MRTVIRLCFSLCFVLVLWAPRAAHATACTAGCAGFFYTGVFNAGAGTVTATMTGVTAGHSAHIFYCISPTTYSVTGITVAGNAATLGSVTATQSGAYTCGMAFRANLGSGSNAVVMTLNTTCASGCDFKLSAEDWPDSTTSVIDGQNASFPGGQGAAGVNLPCGNITTTGSNDTIEVLSFNTGAVDTAPSGYSTAYTRASTTLSLFFLTSVTAGTYNPTPKTGDTSANHLVVCAGFTQAAAAGGPPAGSLNLLGVGK